MEADANPLGGRGQYADTQREQSERVCSIEKTPMANDEQYDAGELADHVAVATETLASACRDRFNPGQLWASLDCGTAEDSAAHLMSPVRVTNARQRKTGLPTT